jgi:4-amino-4-deoxy-L-arabinose transferase-like glycosyltransferase
MGTNILRTGWLWLFLWIGLVATALLSRPALPIDETRYLSVAWEMWQSNQFLVPQSNGQPYSHKPPLLFWLMQCSWWIFGVNEWSARLITPLFGLASLFLTKRLTEKLWPSLPECSRTSPLILLSMSLWGIFCTLTMFDMLVTFFTLAAYCVLLAHAKKPSLYSWSVLGLIIGLGLLAKGPVSLVYIVPPIILGPLWIASSATKWWQWYGGLMSALVLGALLALAWAIPASLAGGEEYGRAILFSQTAGRMAQSFAHKRPFYWYLLLLPLILFPWSLWLPFWRGWKIQCDQSLRFCFYALIPAFIILSLISGKQIHYILPLLPVFALLLSRIAASSPAQKPHDVWLYCLFFTFLATLLFVLPVMPVLGRDAVISKYMPLSVGIVPLVTGIILVWVYAHRKAGDSQMIISVCVLFHLIILQIVLSHSVNTLFKPNAIIRSLSLADKANEKIAVYPENLKDQFQFAARLTKPVVVLHSLSELQAWSNNNPSGHCLIFEDKNKSLLLGAGTAAIPYKDNWLLLSKAEQLRFVE